MTDEVQKIREEVERLKVWNNNVRNSTRHMTLQEEDFNRGKHSSYLEILNFIDSLQEEPVNENLVKELPKVWDRETLDEYAYQVAYDLSNDWLNNTATWDDVETAVKLGANWQKQQMMKDAFEVEIEITSKGILLPNLKVEDFDYADKVRMIIIKED